MKASSAPSADVFCKRHTMVSSAPLTMAVRVPSKAVSSMLPVTFTLSPALSIVRFDESIGLPFMLSTLAALDGIFSFSAGSPISVYCSLLALKSLNFKSDGNDVTMPANDALACRAASPIDTLSPLLSVSANCVNSWFI